MDRTEGRLIGFEADDLRRAIGSLQAVLAYFGEPLESPEVDPAWAQRCRERIANPDERLKFAVEMINNVRDYSAGRA